MRVMISQPMAGKHDADVKAIREELIEKYKVQLEIYKTALEEALQRKVDKVYIYSTYLDKPIFI